MSLGSHQQSDGSSKLVVAVLVLSGLASALWHWGLAAGTTAPVQVSSPASRRRTFGRHAQIPLAPPTASTTRFSRAPRTYTCGVLHTEEFGQPGSRAASGLSPPQLLQHGVPLYHQTAASEEYKFYQICLVREAGDLLELDIRVERTKGDPDLYVSTHHVWPSTRSNDYISASIGSDSLRVLTDNDYMLPGATTVYLAVFGRKPNSEFTIEVAVLPAAEACKRRGDCPPRLRPARLRGHGAG